MRIMKNMGGDYLSLTIDQAPRKFWELLFPLPYRGELMQEARLKELEPLPLGRADPAGIRVSTRRRSRPPNAYGLTQVRPRHGPAVSHGREGIQALHQTASCTSPALT